MGTAYRVRVFPLLLLAGKLPARAPSILRSREELRTPARDNPPTMRLPRAFLLMILVLGAMALVLIATLLLGWFLLR